METNTNEMAAGTEFTATEIAMQIATLREMCAAAYDAWYEECVRAGEDEIGTPDRCAELGAEYHRLRAWLDAAAIAA